jgi:hypothetical protein
MQFGQETIIVKQVAAKERDSTSLRSPLPYFVIQSLMELSANAECEDWGISNDTSASVVECHRTQIIFLVLL